MVVKHIHVKLKMIHSIPQKTCIFVWQRHTSWINKNPPSGNFARISIWHTIVVSVFHFFGLKTDWRDDLVENLMLNPNNHYRYKTVVFVTRTSV